METTIVYWGYILLSAIKQSHLSPLLSYLLSPKTSLGGNFEKLPVYLGGGVMEQGTQGRGLPCSQVLGC